MGRSPTDYNIIFIFINRIETASNDLEECYRSFIQSILNKEK